MKKLNEFAPAATLLVVIAGFVWAGGRWSAQLETLRQDVQELGRTAGSVQADMRSMQADMRSVQADMRSMQADMRSVQADMRSVQADMRSMQAEVRSVQETLPHMVSCMIDLQRFEGAIPGWNRAGGDARQDGQGTTPMPASCEHALARTTPAQGD